MPELVTHCSVAFCIRLILIYYGEVQDKISEVQFTDIDYKVFTDAARYLLQGNSPFERHTYRYTPLLALILTPNIFLHPAWGKLLFSLIDLLVAVLVYRLVKVDKFGERTAIRCALLWLYNPLSIIIATRGNADSIAAALVIATLLALRHSKLLLAGCLHALAIHFRLYPIAFSLAMYLSLPAVRTMEPINKHRVLFNALYPTYERLQLVVSCLVTLTAVTSLFYWLYGYQFIYESILYHLSRQDTKHNFSVYFYLQYLSSGDNAVPLWHRLSLILPQFILLLSLSSTFGTSHRHLPFAFLCSALVLVSYNSVLTCQYFVWFLSLLPLSMPRLALSRQQAVSLTALWLAAQLAWLLPAYWLEFRGRNTFLYIWLQSVAFFCANMALLARLIRAYTVHNCRKVD